MAHRIGYFDMVGRALGGAGGKVPDVARAIEQLSATFREGRADFDRGDLGRAAYLWHLLPAHVCDLSRLFLDLPDLFEPERERLSLLGLGAGPGTEVLALLDAITAVRSRGALPALTHVSARRVDLSGDWDASFAALLEAVKPDLARRDPGFGTAWTLDAPARSIACDLSKAPLPDEVLEAAAQADLVVMANFLTEVAPRGTDELPGGLREVLAALYQALPRGADVILLDRAGAPGASARLEAAVDLAMEVCDDAEGVGPRPRTTRCACGLTRQVKAIYEQVRLPTTKDEDRPVLNCRTEWWHVRV
jgi:hypothetical protein